MPSASTITIADQVPTNHVFNPITTGATSFLETTTKATGATQESLVLQMDRSSTKRATDRVTVRLNVPFEQTVDGAVTVRSTARFIGEFVVPADCSSTERLMLATMVQNVLANSVVKGYVSSRDQLY